MSLIRDYNSAPIASNEKTLRPLIAVIEKLGFESSRSISRSSVRTALEQAGLGEKPTDHATSHIRLQDAIQSLGLRCRAIDCTIDQALEMATDGAQLIARTDDDKWLAIVRVKGRRLLMFQPDDDRLCGWFGTNKILRLLGRAATGELTSCIVIEPGLSVPPSTSGTKLKPLARLLALLKPEWSDIWIVIVFAMIIGLLSLATPIAVETLVNTVAFGKFLQPVVILSLMLLAFLAFSGALRALQTFVVEIIQRRLFARVAADIAYRLPRVQAESMEAHYGRELVNRFFDVVVVQKVSAQLLLDGVSVVMGTLIGMAMLAFYHPWLLGFDVMLLIMIALIVFVLGRGAVKSSIRESKSKYKMAAWLQDLAGCPTAFRHFGAPQFALERTDNLIFDYLNDRAAHFRILMRQIVFALGMQAIASTVLLGLGGWLVISGQLTLGQLVAAELIVAVIVGSFAKLGKHMESYYDVLASVDKLGVLFDLPMEQQHGLINLPTVEGELLELKNIGYRNASGQQVLNDLNLKVRAEDRVAISGPGDSGKSTLIDLLFGLRKPSQGKVVLSGVQLGELRPETVRHNVAMVREVEVFDGTITENVRLGRAFVSATDVRNALAGVGFLENVSRMSKRLDTRLNSSGYPLSSTQLRRLMVARACAGAPKLLLIDGVLDALPDQEAQDLLTWLADPKRPWGLIIVTARPGLAALCNKQLALNRGFDSTAGNSEIPSLPHLTEVTADV